MELRAPDAPPAEGAPDAFLLVHGFAQNRLAYTSGAFPASLSRLGARVFAGELRGHGLSRVADLREVSMEKLLHVDLPALIAAVQEISGAARVHLVGHSMGGMLGYALLADPPPMLASLTTFGAPVLLGKGRPLLKAVAAVAAPIVHWVGPGTIPMDALLKVYAPLGARKSARGVLGFLETHTRLAYCDAADAVEVKKILSRADPAAKAVFLELAWNAVRGRAVIGGVDMALAVASSPLPVAALIGTRDLFGGPESLDPVRTGPGPRRVVEIPGAGHVDVTMGLHTTELAADLLPFLTRPRGV